jgi:alpha-ribazole phosphatase
MMKLLLVRHGLTEWNDAGRFQGQTDVPLSPTGRQQAQALGQRLSEEPLDLIYVSDLMRTVETARAVVAYHTCPVIVEPRLREIRFGKWEGMTYAEIARDDPETLRAWETRAPQVSGPGGETIAQLAGRIQSFLDDLGKEVADKIVLIVSHGGALQVMLCLLLGLPPNQYWQFRLSQASLSEAVLYPEGVIINRLNDTCHLESPSEPSLVTETQDPYAEK